MCSHVQEGPKAIRAAGLYSHLALNFHLDSCACTQLLIPQQTENALRLALGDFI
jgi:hypothetical protein